MKRMIDIDTNNVQVTPLGDVSSGTMTYEAHKLGSIYIVLVKSTIVWDESGNSWKITVKGVPAVGTWISGKNLSSISSVGTVGSNPGSGIAILYR